MAAHSGYPWRQLLIENGVCRVEETWSAPLQKATGGCQGYPHSVSCVSSDLPGGQAVFLWCLNFSIQEVQ